MSTRKNGFRILDHTADVGLQAHGADLAELFANAARGMFSIVVSLETVQPTEQFPLQLTADNLEDLLVNWLSELLYLFSAKQILFRRFEITEIDNRQVLAKAFGEPLDQSRHELQAEIKAVTYHDLEVRKLDHGWSAKVLFDV